MRISKKTLASSIGSALGLMVLVTAPAMAASTFSDHLWQFADGGGTNIINFNRGLSRIYDDSQLHIQTDDNLFLDAPVVTQVQGILRAREDIQVNNQVAGTYTGNRIFDNVDLNITTDDNLHINAPGTTTVSGALTAIGAITGNLTGNVTGNVSGTAATVTGAAQSAITSVGTLTGLTVAGAPVGNVGLVNSTAALSTAGGSVFQGAIKGRANVAAGFGSSTLTDPSIAWGVRGEATGSALTGTSNYITGVLGQYKIAGTNASLYPKAGVIGQIFDGTTTADAAVMAELDGDTAVTTARAGYGIMMINSTPGSGFDYGMDLKLQVITGLETSTQPFKKADIRLSSSQEVYSGSATTRAAVRAQAGTQGAIGSVYLSSAGKMYLKVAAGDADTDWQRVTATVAD